MTLEDKKLNIIPKRRFKGRISRKLILGMLLVALIPLGVAGYLGYRSSSDVLIENSFKALGGDAEAHALEVEKVLSGFGENVIFLANTPPIQGIIRARKNDGIDPQDGSTYKEWTNRLGVIFFEIAQSSGSDYLQVRYIDENGKELVRVDSKDGQIIKVSDDRLQDKSDRYYFIDTISLKKDELFVSRIDLNKEGSPPEIEVPYIPVVRYGTPVFDEMSGEQKGIVIINIGAKSLLGSFHNITDESHNQEIEFFVDKEGYYLLNPNKEKEWGSSVDLDTGYNLRDDFSEEVYSLVLSGESGTIDLQNDKYILAYHPVFSNSEDESFFWVVFELTPRDFILAPVINLRNILFFAAFGFGLIAVFFSILFSRSFTKPIDKLTLAAESLSDGDLTARSDVKSDNEFGALSYSFNKMADSILEARTGLEDKIKSRTDSINKGKLELEKQQEAILNILEDIEDEKDNVTKEQEKTAAILHNIGDGVFVVDNSGNIIVFNSQAEKISGFKKDEVIGKKYDTILRFVNEKDTTKINSKFIEDVMETGENQEMPLNTILIQRDKRKVPVAGSAVALKDKGGNVIGCIVVFRDITKEREIDRAKSEFISVASHQLRTPMTGIQWVIERFLKKETKLSKQGKEYLEDLHTSSVRLSELVDSLLNVSRIESGGGVAVTPEKLDLIKFIEDYIGELTPLLAKKSIDLKFEDHPESFEIVSDPKVLRNVMQSIVSNAIEYTPESGSIDITVEKNTDVMIKIKDTGIGIPEAEQSRMFEKFHRADNAKVVKTDGTGLGLYIAKKATETLGGKIDFISHEGKGTTFYVELPLESKANTGGKDLL
mgnify:CR=1 FL=1